MTEQVSVTNEPLILDVNSEQAFWYLADIENENAWHPDTMKVTKTTPGGIGFGTVFTAYKPDGSFITLKVDEFEPVEKLGNTIVRNDSGHERWSGIFSTDSENKTVLTQTWQVFSKYDFTGTEKAEKQAKIQAYFKYLDPYLQEAVNKNATNI